MHFCKSFILLTLLICRPLQAAYGAIFSETLDDLNLRIRTASLQDTKNLGQAAELFAREIDRCLQFSGSSEKLLQLTILRPQEKRLPDENELCFSFETSSLEISYGLINALLLRRIQENNPEAGEKIPSAAWITAAICNRIFFNGKGIKTFYSPDFRTAREQFLAGHFPRLELLLIHPVPPGNDPLFRLYLLHCDLLASVLENQQTADPFFHKLFALESYGRTPSEAFEFLLRPQWSAQETLQGWYEKKVLAESGRGWQLNEADNVLAQLQDLLNISVIQAGETSAIKRMPLRDIPKLLENYKLNPLALSIMQNKILKLAKKAPLLLRNPLYQFNAALVSLQDGKTSRFKKQFRQASKTFDDALDRQNKIAELLNYTAQKEIPLLNPFVQYLSITDQYLALRNELSAIPWE
ncbi:MAG: hypothetical protein WCT05_05020 [Lentisphaeria bacterium]